MAELKDVEEVLLSVLRDDNKNEINKKIAYFNDSDWQALYGLTVKTGLFPIFYIKLLKLELENIPSLFLSELKNLYLLNLRKNIILERELLKVLTHLNKNNIVSIPLKGPLLARLLYGDLALRQAPCDLDLLVHFEKVKETEDRLKEVGYFYNSRQVNPRFFYNFRKQIGLAKEIDDKSRIILDLHWDFRDGFTDTHLQDFWLNAEYIQMEGCKILWPSHKDLLLFLVLTSISNFDFVRLKYLHDIHNLIMRLGNKTDWEKLFDRAKELGLDTALFFVLRLCQDLWNTDIPKEFLEMTRPPLLKERICHFYINKNNVLRFKEKIRPTYTWRHFISSYLYSKNIFDCAKITYKKIFLSWDEFMLSCHKPLPRPPHILYIKRLLKPISQVYG